MDCPRCKLPLTAISSVIEASLCSECEGVWLSREALEKCLALPREYLRNSPLWVTLEADHPEISLDQLVPCPVCQVEMKRFPYDGKSQVMIDACTQHGLWLDDGELTKILDYKAQARESEPDSNGHQRVHAVHGAVWHKLAHWFGTFRTTHHKTRTRSNSI